MDKVTQVNIEGEIYGFVAGQAVTGVSSAASSAYVKIVSIPEGADIVEGMLLSITFSNGNTAGFGGEKTVYSSDGQTFFYDPQLTDEIMLPPVDCYIIQHVSGEEYTYQAFPVFSVNGVVKPYCNGRGKPSGGALWEAGDTVTVLCLSDKFLDTITAGPSQVAFNAAHPIGEVYVQYPAQLDPDTLYNRNGIRSVWTLQTQYDGAFFRASGGNAVSEQTLNVSTVSGTSITFATAHSLTVGSIVYDNANDEYRKVSSVTNTYTVVLNSAFTNPDIATVKAEQLQNSQNAYHRHTMAHTHSLQSHTHTLTNGTAKASTSATYSYNIFRSSGDTATGLGSGAKGNFKAPSGFISYTTTLSGRTDGPSNNTSGAASTDNTSYNGSSSDSEARPTNFAVKVWKRTA